VFHHDKSGAPEVLDEPLGDNLRGVAVPGARLQKRPPFAAAAQGRPA
jgi:hypothetical protein